MKKFLYVSILLISSLFFTINVKAAPSPRMFYESYSLDVYSDLYNEISDLIINNSGKDNYFCTYTINASNLINCFYNGSFNLESNRYFQYDNAVLFAVIHLDGTGVIDIEFKNDSNMNSIINNGNFNQFLVYAKNVFFDYESDLFSSDVYSAPTHISGYTNYNLFYNSSSKLIKGFLNNLFEVDCVNIHYEVNYYYNDVLDSSKSISNDSCVGSSIVIPNKSDSIYHIDNNNYDVVLLNEQNNFNIYYYDDLYGTDYNQIDSRNSQIPFPFNMDYIKEVFPHIDFTKFTMYEQFNILLLINIFFILFIFVFVYFLVKLWFYLTRLF